MSTSLIYIVDDEPSIIEAVQFALEKEGFSVRAFSAGQDCLQSLQNESPNLILLDIGLIDGSGFDFFRLIRECSDSPIIFLTARHEEVDRVVGLEMGADDYVIKPFSLRELVARVRVVLRRSATTKNNTQKKSTNTLFFLDHNKKEIRYHGIRLMLTAHEYRLLEVLINHPGQVFSRAQLLDQAWDAPEHRLERTIDSHIKSLRNKLRDIAVEEDPIRTLRGMGYFLVIEQ